ncbi:MAG: LysR substrate-binding domain-containing protein [Leptolyngbyaceae bacterium]|nr:LysR substrate-binding domain-containing protein [Leptolyngbyaceae bacterium]
MEVYQIKVFLEVARCLSFTEAADALNLTQPAVSAKIKSLESELGVPLFYRLGRKIQLTEIGQFLFENGPELIEVENKLLIKVQEIKRGKSGSLKIGCTAAIADGWLPEIIFKYRRQYSGIQTQCVVFESNDFLYRAITDNQVDIGISDINFEEFTEISATAVDTINYAVIAAADHPLAEKDWLSLKDLQKESWVIFPAGSPSHLVFETRLIELGLALSDFAQVEIVDTLSLMRTYLTQGRCLGFSSTLEFQAERRSGMLVSIPLQEFALSGNIFLLLPKRLSQLATPDIALHNHRLRSVNPIQKFASLIQSPPPSSSGASEPEPPTVSSKPIRLRSPSPILRTTHLHPRETMTLVIGVQNGTIPTVTAGLVIQRLGLLEHFLPKTGRYSSTQYQIHWRDFSTGAPIIEGLNSGKLNIGILGDYPLLLSAAQPLSLDHQVRKTRLVSFVSTNPDGSCSAVIVPNHSELQCIEDLRGGVIAVPFSSSAHGLVMRSLNSANLLTEVRLTFLENSNLDFPFSGSTQADGYAHFAPFHDIACRRGRFRYLPVDQANILPAFYGVVVGEELAEQYPEVVIAYLKALSAAQYWYATTPSALSLISQWTRLDAEIVSQVLCSSDPVEQSGRFFSNMSICSDWLNLHIAQLSLVPGNEVLSQVNLNQWIQPEFLHQVQNS